MTTFRGIEVVAVPAQKQGLCEGCLIWDFGPTIRQCIDLGLCNEFTVVQPAPSTTDALG